MAADACATTQYLYTHSTPQKTTYRRCACAGGCGRGRGVTRTLGQAIGGGGRGGIAANHTRPRERAQDDGEHAANGEEHEESDPERLAVPGDGRGSGTVLACIRGGGERSERGRGKTCVCVFGGAGGITACVCA